MKVLLINPSLKHSQIGHYQTGLEKNRGAYAPLGLCYLAGTLRKADCEVKIYDCETELSRDRLLNSAVSFDPDWVGIYTMTWTFRQAVELVDTLKAFLPKAKFVAGGPNVTAFPYETLQYSNFDYAIYGEGEDSVIDFLRLLRKEITLAEVKGLVYKNNSKVTKNDPQPLISSLDRICYPARDLLNLSCYFDVFSRRSSFITMVTSRGCPYDCIFCDRENRMGHTWRAQSAQRIIEEIKECKSRYGIKEVMFFDDEFIIDKARVYGLCELMLSENLKVDWECRARVDQIDERLLNMMRRAGCYRIRFGFESGNEHILRLFKKNITLVQSLNAACLARKTGLEIFGYFMIGSPEETPETVEDTINFALKLGLDFAIFSKTILIPGSELFEWAVSNKFIPADYWQRYLLGEERNGAPAISTKILPETKVDEYITTANRRFYNRAPFLFKKMLKIRSFSQAYRQFKIAKSLLR